MNRGTDPAFPSHRGGTQPEPGLSILEYVSLEVLAALVRAEGPARGDGTPYKYLVRASFDIAEVWLAEREKRTAPKAQ